MLSRVYIITTGHRAMIALLQCSEGFRVRVQGFEIKKFSLLAYTLYPVPCPLRDPTQPLTPRGPD